MSDRAHSIPRTHTLQEHNTFSLQVDMRFNKLSALLLAIFVFVCIADAKKSKHRDRASGAIISSIGDLLFLEWAFSVNQIPKMSLTMSQWLRENNDRMWVNKPEKAHASACVQ